MLGLIIAGTAAAGGSVITDDAAIRHPFASTRSREVGVTPRFSSQPLEENRGIPSCYRGMNFKATPLLQ